MKDRIFRIDDFGASSKYYAQRGRKKFYFNGSPIFYFPLANFWFLKRVWPFKGWGKYEELTVNEIYRMVDIFADNDIVPVLGVTACWVENDGQLIPYYKKFPEQAKVLKEEYEKGRVIIANHGLTHCIVGNHLPRLWGTNRQFHREFWSYLPQEWHDKHIIDSQRILEEWLSDKVTVFVPPGHIWSKKTYNALKRTNIKYVLALRYMMDSDEDMVGIHFKKQVNDFNFHDRDLKMGGFTWLYKKISEFNDLRRKRA